MLFELVRRARYRFLCNEVLAQLAYALSAAFGSVILLLLLGTQILDWHWLILLPAVTLGWGAYRVWKRIPSNYRLARTIDSRLRLADTLATAVYYSSAPGARVSESIRLAQLEQADRLAGRVSLPEAVPFQVPKSLYAMGLLIVVASSLFALRYGLNRKLDLRPPLARIVQERLGLGEPRPDAQVTQKLAKRQRPSPLDRQVGLSVPEARQGMTQELDPAPDSALETSQIPDVDNSKAASSKGDGKQTGKASSSSEEGDRSGDSESEDAENSSGGKNSGEQSASKEMPKGQAPGNGGSPQTGGENSSLMNKFRDAMSNLLSRMRPSGAGGGRQQSAASQNGREGQAEPGSTGQRGSRGEQAGTQQAGSQDGEASNDGQTSESAQANGSIRGSEEPSSKQAGSGVGKQDGNKDVKSAEQLAAMGKISEIIGKRSANVTGEATIEVQSATQQLRTPYSQRAARHGETIGEINRDEVPVALQPYVQQYFEQIRKQSARESRGSETKPNVPETARPQPVRPELPPRDPARGPS